MSIWALTTENLILHRCSSVIILYQFKLIFASAVGFFELRHKIEVTLAYIHRSQLAILSCRDMRNISEFVLSVHPYRVSSAELMMGKGKALMRVQHDFEILEYWTKIWPTAYNEHKCIDESVRFAQYDTTRNWDTRIVIFVYYLSTV